MITVERTDFVSVPVTDLERSTRFAGETFDTGVCHTAHFHDHPDGNTLMLHRRYAPHED